VAPLSDGVLATLVQEERGQLGGTLKLVAGGGVVRRRPTEDERIGRHQGNGERKDFSDCQPDNACEVVHAVRSKGEGRDAVALRARRLAPEVTR
jgi:hypothetical protein